LATMIGTVTWCIKDDDGMTQKFTIPNTCYNSSSPCQLFLPQHHAQIADDNHPKKRGTWCGTFDDAIELHWGQRNYKRTIKLDTLANIALVRLAPGHTQVHAFCHKIGQIEATMLDENETHSMPAKTNMASDNDDLEDGSYKSNDEQDDDSLNPGDKEPTTRRHPDLPNNVSTNLREDGNATVIPT
jgi:hypothetical protein